jgi:hypothetical protein
LDVKESPAVEPSIRGSLPRKRVGHRSSRHAASRRRRRLRIVYFTLASVWGFMTGTAAILGSLAAAGRPLTLGPRVGTVLAVSIFVALFGGFVAARAYREIAEK